MPAPRIPYHPLDIPQEEGLRRLREDLEIARRRRSVREFSDRPVPREMIETAVAVAGTAPSGANRQPWLFVAIDDPALKRYIREKAEEAERDFYRRRAPKEWLDALEPLGTDENKEYLETAPWLIVVFRHDHEPDGRKNYYVPESVGIAVGFLIQALHRAGLCTLTHTPAPMSFLREVCGRPAGEKPYVLMPVGYAAEGCTVPDIARKPLEVILQRNV